MGYIYIIKNLLNNKKYIGKTIRKPQIRWKEHIKDNRHKNLPLQKAFDKYGINNFSFKILEECENEKLNEREIFYIQKYDSYNNGYNSTPGGLGKSIKANTYKINPEEWDTVYNLYLSGKTIKKISEEYSCNREVISRIIHKFENKKYYKNNLKRVAQLNINTEEIINIFSSITEALNF